MEPLTPERRRRQTRDHLLAAAAEIFARRGFHEATLEEVAAAAGFSKGAVYSNFTGKDDLFLSLLEHHVTETFARVRAALEASEVPAGDRLGDFVQLAVENFEYEQASAALYLEFWLYAVRHPDARQRLADIDRAQAQAIEAIVTGERSGTQRVDQGQWAVLARLVVALFHGIGIVGLIDPGSVDARFLEAAVRLVDRGVSDLDT
ncbi:MAG: TetR/AcrR family transcriptional regulator [Acidimicrobiales bacterium]